MKYRTNEMLEVGDEVILGGKKLVVEKVIVSGVRYWVSPATSGHNTKGSAAGSSSKKTQVDKKD